MSRLIIVTGIPATGKTSVVDGLSEMIDGSSCYHKDDVNNLILQTLGRSTDTRSGKLYDEFVSPLTYQVIEGMAEFDLKGIPKSEENIVGLIMKFSNDSGVVQIASNLCNAITGSNVLSNVFIDGTYHLDINDPERSQKLYERWNAITENLFHFRLWTTRSEIMSRLILRGRKMDRWKIEDPEKFFDNELMMADSSTKPIYVDSTNIPIAIEKIANYL